MKKLIILLFIAFNFCHVSYAQQETMHMLKGFDRTPMRYGFYLGFNVRGYEMKAADASLKAGGGFQLGVLADLKLSEYVSVITAPGVITSFNQLTFAGESTNVGSTLFHLPLSLKVSTLRMNNVRGFVIGGVSYNYNFTANGNNENDGKEVRDFKLLRNTFIGEFGIGASFYFEYFKFSPSIKTVYGFQNEFIGLGTEAIASISELRSRGVFLTLTFQ